MSKQELEELAKAVALKVCEIKGCSPDEFDEWWCSHRVFYDPTEQFKALKAMGYDIIKTGQS